MALLGPLQMPDRVDDGAGREEARDDREHDRLAEADESHEPQREDRPDDRAEVVHRPLEPVGPPVGRGIDRIGQQGVP